jgi:hypothetical protein
MSDDVDLFGHEIVVAPAKARFRKPLLVKPFPSRELTLAGTTGFTIRDSKDVVAAYVRPVAGGFKAWLGSSLIGTYPTLAEAENAARLALEPKPKGPRR